MRAGARVRGQARRGGVAPACWRRRTASTSRDRRDRRGRGRTALGPAGRRQRVDRSIREDLADLEAAEFVAAWRRPTPSCAEPSTGRARQSACARSRRVADHARKPPGPNREHPLPEPETAREWLAHDAADPPLRGARGRDVRQGEDRRLPAPRDRRGGDGRRRGARAARQRLPDLHLPRARPRARARHATRQASWRSCSAARTAAPRPRRLDAHVRPRAALHGRLRDRRRQPAARRRAGAGLRLPGHRGRHALHVRRRRHQPGHVRRDAQPGRAVEAAGRLHGHQQPVRHGHRARAPLGGDRPVKRKARASACPACAATAWTCSTPTA